MHIPGHMISGPVCPVTAFLSVVGIGLAAFRAFLSEKRPAATRFAAITALIFAGQMMNFPVRDGTSGHLLGAVLATALMGIPFGILSLAVVITVQCLMFSDGGLSVLGANIFNMAIIGAGLGGMIHKYLTERHPARSAGYYTALAMAAWSSIMLAALACSIELAVSGVIGFFKVATAMLSTHALIGIGEALITLAFCFALESRPVEISRRRSAAVPFAAAAVIAAILSPFASSFPDGLEWVAQRYRFLHESAPAFAGPLPDYTVPFITNNFVSVGLAGLIGVLATFVAAWSIAKIVQHKHA